ncbi:MAG TPA: hypothetical protein VFS94_08235 [Gemmatimonadales bacterium]|nr:hypothetical protein [Gemmatimonadales bacterium]
MNLERWLALSAILLVGCSEAEVASDVPLANMPTLQRMGVELPDSLVPEFAAGIGVSTGGEVAFRLDRRPGPPVFVVVDSAGNLVGQARNSGQGPLELNQAINLEFVTAGVVAVNLEQLRAVMYDRSVRPRSMVRLPIGSRLAKLAHDSLDVYLGPANDGPMLVRVPLDRADTFRVLLGPEDSAFARASRSLRAFEIDGPPVSTWSGGVVVGDPMQDRLLFYDDLGRLVDSVQRSTEPRLRTERELERDREVWESRKFFRGPDGKPMIPPQVARKLDSLDVEVLPTFSRAGLQRDGDGRIWVIREENDSAFADVYRDTELLGRVGLECPSADRSISIAGDFFAQLCPVTDHDWREWELQLFRIEG